MAAKSTNQPDLRDVVHLGGALPPEVVLEVVYLPTFHEALGIRMTTGHLEWWQRDRVESVSSRVGGAMLIRAERALAFPSNDDREWRGTASPSSCARNRWNSSGATRQRTTRCGC